MNSTMVVQPIANEMRGEATAVGRNGRIDCNDYTAVSLVPGHRAAFAA